MMRPSAICLCGITFWSILVISGRLISGTFCHITCLTHARHTWTRNCTATTQRKPFAACLMRTQSNAHTRHTLTHTTLAGLEIVRPYTPRRRTTRIHPRYTPTRNTHTRRPTTPPTEHPTVLHNTPTTERDGPSRRHTIPHARGTSLRRRDTIVMEGHTHRRPEEAVLTTTASV